MTKTQALALAAMVALATACAPEQPSAQTATQGKPAPVTATTEQQASDNDSADALPAGVELDFRYVVRSDEVVEREGRLPRRRMGLVYIDSERDGVFESISRSMADAGFTLVDQRPQGKGRLRAKYKKPGFGTVIAVVGPVSGTAKGRRGRLLLDWPVEK